MHPAVNVSMMTIYSWADSSTKAALCDGADIQLLLLILWPLFFLASTVFLCFANDVMIFEIFPLLDYIILNLLTEVPAITVTTTQTATQQSHIKLDIN